MKNRTKTTKTGGKDEVETAAGAAAGKATPQGYPSDVSDEEWAFAAPYLTLMRQDAPQREYSLREVFNGLRWLDRTRAQWRMLPNDFPPWWAVYQQTRRWLEAGGC